MYFSEHNFVSINALRIRTTISQEPFVPPSTYTLLKKATVIQKTPEF